MEPKLNIRIGNPPQTLYEFVGGMETCQRLSEVFHDRIAQDPVLRAKFPKNLTHATEKFTLFLAERLGGAKEYTAKRGKQSLRCRHTPFVIGAQEEERWLVNMFVAMEEVGIQASARQRLQDYFTETAHTLADPFLPLYKLPLDALRATLEENPALATASDLGRTLLGNAVLHWDAPRVRLLLEYDADVTTLEGLGHDLLYQATRGVAPGAESEGCAVVKILLELGADVNRQSGAGQCTPLHNAARRGCVEIAEVLLEAGADIEKKDAKGESPLRRAVNCKQEKMVVFLLSRGADPRSQDKKGRFACPQG